MRLSQLTQIVCIRLYIQDVIDMGVIVTVSWECVNVLL